MDSDGLSPGRLQQTLADSGRSTGLDMQSWPKSHLHSLGLESGRVWWSPLESARFQRIPVEYVGECTVLYILYQCGSAMSMAML